MQPGIGPGLHPPALVVGQVEVQPVQLVHRHQVDHPEHVVLGQEVPGHVEMGAAPGERRGVGDPDTRDLEPLEPGDRPEGAGGEQLPQGLRRVEGPEGVARDDLDSAGRHGQGVGLGGDVVAYRDRLFPKPGVSVRTPGRGSTDRGAGRKWCMSPIMDYFRYVWKLPASASASSCRHDELFSLAASPALRMLPDSMKIFGTVDRFSPPRSQR